MLNDLQILNSKFDNLEFIILKNKIPIRKLHENKFSYEEVSEKKEILINKGLGLGIIAPQGHVIVDSDCTIVANRISEILDNLNIKRTEFKTKNGRHFIFKVRDNFSFKNAARIPSPLHPTFFGEKPGADTNIDMRFKSKFATHGGYVVTPFNDSNREFLRIEECDVIPLWLCPIDKDISNYDLNISGLEGSRNADLFAYMKTLSEVTSEFSIDEIQEIGKFINSQWKYPLGVSELDTIIREEELVKAKVAETEAEPELMTAKKLLRRFVFKKNKGNLYILEGRIYRNIDDAEMHEIIVEFFPYFKTAKRVEIINYMYALTKNEEIKNEEMKYLVATPTMVYDVFKREYLDENDNSNFITSGLNYEINNHEIVYETIDDITTSIKRRIKNEKMEKYMNDMFGKNKSLVYQAIGYSFLRTAEKRKSFWFVGPKRTGKSTFLDELIAGLFTRNGITNTTIKALSTTFGVAGLETSMINMVDDISLKTIGDANVFKSAISGNTIYTDVKFKKPMSFRPISTWFVTANKMPKFEELDDAIFDRIVIIPVENVIKEGVSIEFTEFDKTWLIGKCIDYISSMLINGKEFADGNVKNLVEAHMIESNFILTFMHEMKNEIDGMTGTECWNKFIDYCSINNVKLKSRIEFNSVMRTKYIDKIDNKKGRVKVWRKL